MTKDLYSDNHPNTSIKGFGFANPTIAKETINKLKSYAGFSHVIFYKKIDKTYQKQVIITMYYRAKHHPHQTPYMRKAMKEFKKGAKELKLNINLI
jgi:hypothetical protein